MSLYNRHLFKWLIQSWSYEHIYFLFTPRLLPHLLEITLCCATVLQESSFSDLKVPPEDQKWGRGQETGEDISDERERCHRQYSAVIAVVDCS